MSQWKAIHRVEAAWPAVVALCNTKQRGDVISYAEIAAASAPVEGKRLHQRVRRHYHRIGVHLVAVVNVGWKLATEAEQVAERTDYHARKAQRSTGRRLHAATSIEPTTLPPQLQRVRDAHIRHASGLIGAGRDGASEIRQILGAPAARPGLPAKGEK